MISIARDNGLVTVINSFSCEPEQQENLVSAWSEAAAELGKLRGIVAAALHKRLDGTRVVNYVQVRSVDFLRLTLMPPGRLRTNIFTRRSAPEA
jgi:hypothetical protein